MTRAVDIEGRGVRVNGRSVGVGSAIPDSGLLHHYDAQEESGASTFTDLEGSNKLSSNGSPTLDSNGINGHQSMLYNGAGDEHTGSVLSLGTNDEYTAAWVLEPVTLNGNGDTFWANGGSDDGYRFRDSSDTDWNYAHNAVTNNGFSGIDTDPHVFVASYDGTLAIDFDKSEVVNNTQSITVSSGTFVLGSVDGLFYTNVYIGEYLHYDVYKNSSERDEISDYLGDRWGVTF